jgi:hypothetical protein
LGQDLDTRDDKKNRRTFSLLERSKHARLIKVEKLITQKQCGARWTNYLDPSIKKDPWTAAEDNVIRDLHLWYGNQWAEIAKKLPGRPCTLYVSFSHSHSHSLTKNVTTDMAVRNRFQVLSYVKKRSRSEMEDSKFREQHTKKCEMEDSKCAEQLREQHTKQCSKCKRILELSSFDMNTGGTLRKRCCRECLEYDRISQKRSRHKKRLRRTVENICDQVRAQFDIIGIQAMVKCESTPGKIPSIRISISDIRT